MTRNVHSFGRIDPALGDPWLGRQKQTTPCDNGQSLGSQPHRLAALAHLAVCAWKT